MGICGAGQVGKRSAGRRRQIWLGRRHQKTHGLGRGLGLTRYRRLGILAHVANSPYSFFLA